MLKTGISAHRASSATGSWPPVRIPIASTWRERTRAVSRGDSPRDELQLVAAEDHRVAAELDDAGLEGDARTGRGNAEDEGDRPFGERRR